MHVCLLMCVCSRLRECTHTSLKGCLHHNAATCCVFEKEDSQGEQIKKRKKKNVANIIKTSAGEDHSKENE